MDDKELLLSKIRDLKTRAINFSFITSTSFLSVEEQSEIRKIEREDNKLLDTFYFGGYDDAERVIAFFVPKFYSFESISEYLKENLSDAPFSAIKVTKDKFTEISHRDYLGSIMALGIKREMIGDIIVTDFGCYLFCCKKIEDFLFQNLKKISRGSVILEKVPFCSVVPQKENTETSVLSVSSLRADNVISSVFNLSRSLCSELIKRGVVFINSAECTKNDMLLREGDKLVLRGKGKAVFKRIIGTSKKGKIRIEIEKYK